jgi:predicted nucleotidyltransferase
MTLNGKTAYMQPLNRVAILKIIRNEMPTLRQLFGVEHLALFGSFARDEASENSDIDLVVSLARPLGFAFIELADYLEEKLGCKVDLVTASTLEIGITDPRRAHIARDIQETLIYV